MLKPALQFQKIKKNKLSNKPCTYITGYLFGLGVNLLDCIVFTIFMVWVAQQYFTRHSYFLNLNGLEQCTLYNDLMLHRWIFMAYVIFKLVDLRFGFNVGENAFGKFVLGPMVMGGFMCMLLLIILWVAYLPSCNVAGSGGNVNICNDYRFCGVQANIDDATNRCEILNPSLEPIYPAITNQDLAPNEIYWTMMIVFGFGVAFGIAKTLLSLLVPQTTQLIRTTAVAIQKLQKDKNAVKQLPNISKILADSKEMASTSEQLDLLFIFSPSQKVVAVITIIVCDLFWCIYSIIWNSYYFQEVQTILPQLVHRSNTPTPNAGLQYTWQVENFICYGIIVFFLIHFLGNSQFLQFETHWITLVTSGITFLISSVMVIIFFFRFWISCNQDGQGWNPCNNGATFCKTQVGSYNWWTNPLNRCQNNYTCPTTNPPQPAWEGDPRFIILFSYVCYTAASSLVIFLVGAWLQYTISERTEDEGVTEELREIEINKKIATLNKYEELVAQDPDDVEDETEVIKELKK